ncbi:MAG: DUF937 domain-containing protein, partial [Pseudorhodobacter sp.]|nr:DUF937 domain-containing protein [Pseudorhodobacter sp.]
MSRGMPSMLALLGLVAVAGYQNRGKLSEMVNDVRGQSGGATPGGGGGLLSDIGGMFQSGQVGSTLSGGLSELVNRFTASGHGHAATSWVGAGANLPVESHDLESALGEDTLNELQQKTGIARPELLKRLSATLPDLVNKMTPEGRLPTA